MRADAFSHGGDKGTCFFKFKRRDRPLCNNDLLLSNDVIVEHECVVFPIAWKVLHSVALIYIIYLSTLPPIWLAIHNDWKNYTLLAW